MPRYFATATISTEFEIDADNPKEATAHFRKALGVDADRPDLELTARDANTGPIPLINPLVTIGLIGEIVGPMG